MRHALALAVSLALALVAAPSAHAAAFLVDSLGTAHDDIHADGTCATPAADGAHCTLTAAVDEANASGFDDVILFDQTLEGDIVFPANQHVFGDPGGGGLQIIGNLDADGHPLIGLDFSARVEQSGSQAPLIHFTGANSALADVAVFGGSITGLQNLIRVALQGSDSVVTGTWLGLRRDGTRASNAQTVGVAAYGLGSVIGDSGANEGNVIADGGGAIDVGASEVTIAGNRIGMDPAGTKALPLGFGISCLDVSADDLVIGGPTAADGNVIAATADDAILVRQATDVVIQSNIVGLSPTGARTDGTTSFGNNRGIDVFDAQRVTIGPGAGQTGGGNVVSNSTGPGISVFSVDDARVAGNLVGTTLAGAPGPAGSLTGNGGEGIWVGYQILPTELPGSKRALVTGNVVRGNGTGIRVSAKTADTTVTDNVVTGSKQQGIEVWDTAAGTTIGTAAAPNRVGGSGGFGIAVQAGATGTTIRGNRVGLAPLTVGAADVAAPNSGGIRTQSPATIGGNEVVRSGGEGIVVDGAGAAATTVTGNSVGTDATGVTDMGNGLAGIAVVGAADVVVGGTGSAANLISGNGGAGVRANDAARLAVTGNTIGATKPGTAALGNDGAGLDVSGSDDLAVKDNLVVANDDGISVSASQRAKLTGNTIGGAAGLGNRKAGIVLTSADDGEVGTLAAGNVIGGSGKEGIAATHAARLRVIGNTVGLKADRSATRPNTGAGVALDDAADSQVSGNVIGASENGVEIHASPRTAIKGNTIGTNAAGDAGLGNRAVGVLVDRSDDVNVGGTNAGDGNTIASSGSHGLLVGATRDSESFAGPAASSGTSIKGNQIGSAPIAAGGWVARPNAGDGVRLLDATNVIVGYGTILSLPGGCSGACNRIEGNDLSGVSIIGDKTAVGNAVRGNLLGDNGRYPIDLRPASGSDDGMTPQDFGRLAILPDADKGADTMLNAPYGVMRGDDHLYGEVVSGMVAAAKPRDLRVDLYGMDTPIAEAGGGRGEAPLHQDHPAGRERRVHRPADARREGELLHRRRDRRRRQRVGGGGGLRRRHRRRRPVRRRRDAGLHRRRPQRQLRPAARDRRRPGPGRGARRDARGRLDDGRPCAALRLPHDQQDAQGRAGPGVEPARDGQTGMDDEEVAVVAGGLWPDATGEHRTCSTSATGPRSRARATTGRAPGRSAGPPTAGARTAGAPGRPRDRLPLRAVRQPQPEERLAPDSGDAMGWRRGEHPQPDPHVTGGDAGGASTASVRGGTACAAIAANCPAKFIANTSSTSSAHVGCATAARTTTTSSPTT